MQQIGLLSSHTRCIRIKNVLTDQTITLEVPVEESILEIRDRYLEYNRHTPIDFFDWVDTVYDPAEVHKTFHANGFANRLVNGILRRE